MSARPAPRPSRESRREVAPPKSTSRIAPIPPEDSRSRAPDFGRLVQAVPSWLASMAVHMAALLLLALWMVPPGTAPTVVGMVFSPSEVDVITGPPPPETPLPPDLTIPVTSEPLPKAEDEELRPPGLPNHENSGPQMKVDLDPLGNRHWSRQDLLDRPGSGGLDGFDGRELLRTKLRKGGEPAVALALKWLAAHQLPDGGWCFNHALASGCKGQCRNPGTLAEARLAATGLALLPFLGAGQTHKQGQYKRTVRDGLYFLVVNMKVSPQGGSLYEPGGRMYSHGIASIALCEAYAMTHDKGLYDPAQQAVNFIVYAQDPVGGGWRYEPRQAGDTSVVGWQIMALKSGHLAYLRVPPATVKKAFQFLDTVQANSGANYGYTDPGAGKATTAIGLLARMHLGWPRDNPALARGVEWLGRQGPSPGDMYYNYYATQVMRHYDGEPWEKWDKAMRAHLLQAQATAGHEAGSWFVADGDHGARQGGRLYATAMATMVLEVNYRVMRIYGEASVAERFPD